VKTTTIDDWCQGLTPTNVAGVRVAQDMAKGIQISRVMSANMTHSTKISAVNRKQLSSDIIDPLFLCYLRVGSVKAEPQWAKYPNLSDRSLVTSEKPILGFYFIAKTVHKLCRLFICAHNLLSLRLPSGRARNLLPPQPLDKGAARETSDCQKIESS
jgi:hypothetical protein